VAVLVVPILLSNRQISTMMVVLILVNSVTSSDKTLVVVLLVVLAMALALHTNHQPMVLVLVSVLVVQVMNRPPHSNQHQVADLVVVLVMMHHLVLVVVLAATNQHHSPVQDMVVMLALSLVEVPVLVEQVTNHHHQAPKYNNMLLILKVSFKIQTHKLSVVQLQVVYKHTHKTSEFASFNHHPFHPQVHSSFEKFAHLNHHHHHLSASANKLLLFLHHPHLFSVKDHHNHQFQLLLKQSFVVWLLCPFHHDRSSLNVFHLSHHDHVMSSLNVGSHTELKLNDAPLFNVLVLPNNINVHATSLSNMNQFKFELSVNSNDLALPKPVHKRTFNNMALNFSMLVHSFNKLALLVLSKISRHQLV
jgi:hypothetical protein